MVWHLVLIKPRTDLSVDDRRALVDAFEHAIHEIPSVRDVHVGRRVAVGAAYERTMLDSADFMVSIAFDDLEGLQSYLRHPAHEELGMRFYQSVTASLAYDFEVTGSEGLTRLKGS